MELSKEAKEKLHELIDKINPYVVMDEKETIDQFKKLVKNIRTFEIPDDEKFLSDDMVYLIPVDSPNKPIKVVTERK